MKGAGYLPREQMDYPDLIECGTRDGEDAALSHVSGGPTPDRIKCGINRGSQRQESHGTLVLAGELHWQRPRPNG